MEIQGHIINESEIVGIGPLLANRSTDQVMMQLYNATRFTYDIHLKQRSITIESNLLKIGWQGDPVSDEVREGRVEWLKFGKGYDEVKQAIIKLITPQ